MGQTDTWYYIDSFPLLNNSLVLKICLMQFIVTILVIPASFFIVSRKSNELICTLDSIGCYTLINEDNLIKIKNLDLCFGDPGKITGLYNM